MNYSEYKKLNTKNKDDVKAKLIKGFREREGLCNIKIKEYSNRNKRNQSYTEISNITGIYGYYFFIYLYLYLYPIS